MKRCRINISKEDIDQLRIRLTDLIKYKETCCFREDEFIKRLIHLHKTIIKNYEDGKETTFIQVD